MQFYVLVIVSAVTLRGTAAQVEECPQYCSPVNNNYGPACASVGRSFKTFPNLCELFKERCAQRQNGGPAIEFVKDGSCTSPVLRRIRPAVCPESCPPDPTDSNPVCAQVGFNVRTFPSYCEMLKKKCENQRRRGAVVNYLTDGSCTTPVVDHEDEGQMPLRQVPDRIVPLRQVPDRIVPLSHS